MGQQQPRVLHPQLSPKQNVEIQRARSPALLSLTIAAAALFQTLHVLQQLECRHFRHRPLHARDQKNSIAVLILAWRSSERLSLQKRRTTDIPSIGIAPLHKQINQAGQDPTQGGFRRPMETAQIGPEPNGKRCFQGERCHYKRREDTGIDTKKLPMQ